MSEAMGLAQSQETPTEPPKEIRKVTPRLFLLSDVEFIVIAIVLNYFVFDNTQTVSSSN